MTSRGQIWKCNICGNVVEVLHEGADSLVCCGQPMILMSNKIEEEGLHSSQVPPLGAKHRPVIEADKDGVVVRVGSVPHPMEDVHYIEWIEIFTKKGVSKKFLKPGDEPIAKFPVSVDVSEVSARAYCNVHGLWKN
jgi:superoxide reductase